MHWMDKLERRFGRYTIPNLPDILACAQVLVFAAVWFVNSSLPGLLGLSGPGLLHGQIWRVITFMAVPQTFSLFSFAIETYMFWFIMRTLENQWGSFYLQLYLLLGIAGSVIAALLTGTASAYYVYLSLFLAYSVHFANSQLLLFFLVPVRASLLGIITGILLALDFIGGSMRLRLQILFGLLAFWVFFGPTLFRAIRAWARRTQWKNRSR